MSILGTILIGFIVGLIARAIKPGDDKLGLIMTTLLGIAGSFLALYAGMAMGLYQEGETAGWIASVIGAVVLLVIYGLIKSRSPRV
ncbi:MAG TPA: GlsB/YeaQ/YmgE family stress response membrane protein [Ramlibacter sp.]|nr:GlsB/YeaQ/YmgE family stress response membrane protein [Ramlibacter sp.]